MINRKELLLISDLKLPGRIDQMDEGQLESYITALDSFIDNFPDQEKKIQADLKEKKYKSIAQSLNAIKETLDKIFAEDKAKECQNEINGLDNRAHEEIEADLTNFLTSISTLSIIIQMANYKNGSADADAGAAEEKPAEVKKDAAPPPLAIKGDNKIKILAVDDAAFFLNLIKRYLDDDEYKLTCLTSGADALLFLAKNEPDVFLFDIEMPSMNGYELARKVKEKGHNAPIIFLTGNSKRDSVIKAVKAGAVDFIVKPGNAELIKSKIQKYVRPKP